ncbi:hypothetical protein ACFL6N_07100, partial [Thermodesulfobacteriota bacterium]
MGIDKRRTQRIAAEITVHLVLRDKKSNNLLVEPVPCMMNDINMYGVGLSLVQILIDSRHLFYTAYDDAENQLYVEFLVSGENSREILLPGRPVWFDRVLTDMEWPFRMGVEFDVEISREDFQLLWNCLSQTSIHEESV